MTRFWRIPLDVERLSIPHGEIHIIRERCKGCAFCVEYCPLDVLVLSEEFNEKGYHPPQAVHPEKCVNCGLCEMICPEFAIFTLRLEPGEGELPAAS